MTDRRKFTVRRSTWLRGALSYVGDVNNAALYRPTDGRMCCLGFVAEQCGVDRESLGWVDSPAYFSTRANADSIVGVLIEQRYGGGRGTTTDLADQAMLINDDRKIDDAERERRLIELFNRHGFDLEFAP